MFSITNWASYPSYRSASALDAESLFLVDHLCFFRKKPVEPFNITNDVRAAVDSFNEMLYAALPADFEPTPYVDFNALAARALELSNAQAAIADKSWTRAIPKGFGPHPSRKRT